ncbi:hypothetical protein [Curvibacter sp. PAE-UM]|uniref:hypothetical protein n=1 Tax=Curvibacter sp. PAE-UM TaxID=1714344 RepID=UPI000A539F8E|nr:hypothetical protein [Curvibacter sp. PAE-UM]
MKALIPLFVYALLSGLIGLLICTWLLWRSKRPQAAVMAALVFFGGPPALYGYVHFRDKRAQSTYEEDVAYLKELCAKHSGDKIYRTVDDVQGVFQMKARNPDGDFQWADQYGMVEPWALAFGDRDTSALELGLHGKGYWFIEQQPIFGQGDGPPFRRKIWVDSGMKVRDKYPYGEHLDEPLLTANQFSVNSLHSRYGYTTEDLTTPELRKRWIGGGRLRIIDLKTKEILAERTDFYRATGPQVKMAWAAGIPCPAGPPRLVNASTQGFIMVVLKPPRSLPTRQQLLQLNGK